MGKGGSENPIYTEFIEGAEYKVLLKAIVVAPKMIITGVVDVKTEVDNKIPHVTMYTDGLKPVHSNDVLEGMFCEFKKKAKEYEVNELYTQVMEGKEGSFIRVMKSNMKKRKFPIYLVKLGKPVALNGVAHTYY